MPNYRNFTGHTICLNDGRVFQPEAGAKKVLVNEKYIPTGDGNFTVAPSKEVINLPEIGKDDIIIVPRMVFDATTDPRIVAPATGVPGCIRWQVGDKLEDGTVLDEKSRFIGQPKSVPGFLVHKN
jgi:hypothetical protein